jgi:hypothetical protein
VEDLKSFRFGTKDVRIRLEQPSSAGAVPFYMSAAYFSAQEVESLLLFPGKNGLSLKDTLDAVFQEKMEDEDYEVCTAAHFLAPIFQNHFSLPKGFEDDKRHKKAYKAFQKSWKKNRHAH